MPKPKKVSKAALNQLMSNHGIYNASLRNVMPLNPGEPRFAGPAYTLRYVPMREDMHP